MGKYTRQFIIALVSSLAVFFGLGILLQWNLFVAAGLAVGTYIGTFLVSKPQMRIGSINIDRLPDGDELKRLLLDAKGDMDAIQSASKQISNVNIQQESQKLHSTGMRILQYLEKHPDRIPTARKFLNYYLDTARDILEKFLPFQASGLRTDDVKRVYESTERALPILNEAFERQFNNLMQNDILDIESDIHVLEMNLKMEGDQ